MKKLLHPKVLILLFLTGFFIFIWQTKNFSHDWLIFILALFSVAICSLILSSIIGGIKKLIKKGPLEILSRTYWIYLFGLAGMTISILLSNDLTSSSWIEFASIGVLFLLVGVFHRWIENRLKQFGSFMFSLGKEKGVNLLKSVVKKLLHPKVLILLFLTGFFIFIWQTKNFSHNWLDFILALFSVAICSLILSSIIGGIKKLIKKGPLEILSRTYWIYLFGLAGMTISILLSNDLTSSSWIEFASIGVLFLLVGVFHRWIENRLKQFGSFMFSLGKEKGLNLLKFVFHFIKARKKPILLSGLLLIAASGLWFAGAFLYDKMILRVERVTPQGLTPERTEVLVKYRGDIFVPDRHKTNFNLFKFTPPIEGEYRFLNDRTVSFLPKNPLKPGTTYRVEIDKSMVKAKNKKRIEGKSFLFWTAPLSVKNTSLFFTYHPISRKEMEIVAEVNFNYEVEYQNIKEHSKLTIEGIPVPYSIEKSFTKKRYYIKSKAPSRSDDVKKVTLTLYKNLTSIGGGEPLGKDVKFDLSLPKKVPLKVEKVEMHYTKGNSFISILFNESVSKDVFPEFVTVLLLLWLCHLRRHWQMHQGLVPRLLMCTRGQLCP